MKRNVRLLRAVCVTLLLSLFAGALTGCGADASGTGSAAGGSGGAAQAYSYVTSGNVKYRVKAEGNYFQFYDQGKWSKLFLKGVNIGAGEPGLFPGDLTISYEDYYRWFGEISAMGANCVRIYTAMRPQFYNALADFNKKAKQPLYFYQGVWLSETDIASLGDAYANNSQIMNAFIDDAKNLADIIHGHAVLPVRAGYASGTYTADVSRYFAGWILGMEWDPQFVKSTNDNNPTKNTYDGKYLYTLSASPFEAFLCQTGDQLIDYETRTYGAQEPLGFVNWVTTDPLIHPNEPHPDDDAVSVNMEDIKTRSAFLPGEFVAYNVYPYYPDSMNYQQDYISYVDSTGKKNPYEAYLKDLKMAHTMPVLIGEFGIPTSRGMTHKSEVLGYNQGDIDETQQGAILVDLLNSIYKTKYAGGLIFTWQDEWFKKTWNNVLFDVPDKRPFWSNVQTNEQSFGLLTFDPGSKQSAAYVDGDISDWAKDTPVLANGTGQLYMKSDERYVYFMVKLSKDFDFDRSTLLIPVDTIDGQGNFKASAYNASFDKAADFLIAVNGKDNTRIVVDSYYDAFYYLYGERYQMIPKVADIRTKNSGRFDPIQLCYNYELTVPPQNTKVPFESYETGKLTFGDANPSNKDYKSLADFCYKDGNLEIKVPWQLLNVMDPSGKQIMNDLYTMQNITPTDARGFSVGLGLQGSAAQPSALSLTGQYDWSAWTTPTYHERLKPAYDVLKKALGQFQ